MNLHYDEARSFLVEIINESKSVEDIADWLKENSSRNISWGEFSFLVLLLKVRSVPEQAFAFPHLNVWFQNDPTFNPVAIFQSVITKNVLFSQSPFYFQGSYNGRNPGKLLRRSQEKINSIFKLFSFTIKALKLHVRGERYFLLNKQSCHTSLEQRIIFVSIIWKAT